MLLIATKRAFKKLVLTHGGEKGIKRPKKWHVHVLFDWPL